MKKHEKKKSIREKFHIYDFFPVGESRLYWYNYDDNLG